MAGGRPQRSDAWGLTAILAAFALLMQALVPTIAVADVPGSGFEICSAGEAKTVTTGQAPQPKGFFGLKCVDCVIASLAGAAPIAPPIPTRVGLALSLRPSLVSTGSQGPRSPPRVREQSPRAPPAI
jgi:hypothetical protein